MTRADVVARIRPPTIAWIFLLMAIGGHFLFPGGRVLDSPYRFLGIGITVAGWTLMFLTLKKFDKAGTTHSTQEKPTTLVLGGPLIFSRNPMYLGLTLFFFGIAVAVGTLPMLIAPVGFWATMNWVFVPHEEKVLEQLLGAEYLNYKRRVRRWL